MLPDNTGGKVGTRGHAARNGARRCTAKLRLMILASPSPLGVAAVALGIATAAAYGITAATASRLTRPATQWLLGLAWIAAYYITASVGATVPVMTSLSNWNLLIGFAVIVIGVVLSTRWR